MRRTLHVDGVATVAGDPVRVLALPAALPAPGAEVGLKFRRDRLHLFEAQSGRRVG